MTFEHFARMNNDDEAEFISVLVAGAAHDFRAHGQPEMAERTMALFKQPGEKGGVAQLASNMKTLHTLNTRNADNPNNRAPVYEVEDALQHTFADAGIKIGKDKLKSIGADFRAVGPPRAASQPMKTY